MLQLTETVLDLILSEVHEKWEKEYKRSIEQYEIDFGKWKKKALEYLVKHDKEVILFHKMAKQVVKNFKGMVYYANIYQTHGESLLHLRMEFSSKARHDDGIDWSINKVFKPPKSLGVAPRYPNGNCKHLTRSDVARILLGAGNENILTAVESVYKAMRKHSRK